MILYFIRHGMPDYELNVLTEKGRDEAEKTSLFLKDEGIERFFVSPTGRTKETAKRTLEKVDKKATIIPWMDEEYLVNNTTGFLPDGKRQWFFWMDEYIQAFRDADQDPLWYEREIFRKTSIKEGLDKEDRNVDEWLESIGVHHDRKTKTYTRTREDVPEKVAVFAHGAMCYAFLSSLYDMTYPHYVNTHHCLNTCGIAIVRIDFDKTPATEELAFDLIKY